MLPALFALAFVILPFLLLDRTTNNWFDRVHHSNLPFTAVAVVIVLFLALDVVLPIPSSIVSTAAGASLGFFPGLIASTLGMTVASLAGYILGRRWGLPMLRRFVPERELIYVSHRFNRRALWVLAAMRPVPVLAEVSAMFAGASALPLGRFVPVSILANAGISAVYCAAGAKAFDSGSLLMAFAASVALPGIAMAVSRLSRGKAEPPT